MNPRRITLLIIFYLSIAIIFTYPLILHFTTHIPGGEEDAPTHVWLLWWFKYSIFDKHINPIFTDYIYYPQVINRTFDIHTFVNGLISLPFQYTFGLITASNIVFLSSFVLSALGANTLTKYLTKSNLAALISGLIYAFFPFVLAQASNNHTNLTTIWFSPFIVLFLLKTLEEAKYKFAILAGLFLGLQALNDLTYTSFHLALCGLIFGYYLVFRRKKVFNFRYLKLLLTLGVSFAILASPMFGLAIFTIVKGFKPDVPLAVQDTWSADLCYFLYPSPFNPLLKQWSRVSTTVSTVESTMYLGYTTLILGLASVWLFKKLRSQRFILGLFLTIFVTFFILSLGPWLKVFNIHTKIPLPFIIYQLLPLIGGIQEPLRFQPLTMLGLSTLAGFSLAYFFSKINNQILKISLAILVGILIFIEYIPTPLPITDAQAPEIYKTIAKESGDFAILDLPVGWNTGNFIFGYGPMGKLQLYQATHEKKIFRGTVARLPINNVFYYMKIPLLHYLADPSSQVLTKEDQDPEVVKKTFRDLNVKYIIVHKKYYEMFKKPAGDSVRLIEETLNPTKLIEDENLAVYKVPTY